MFNVRNPDESPKWKRQFEHFRTVLGLIDERETPQISTLLYCMGKEADGILTSTAITDEDRKKYDGVMKKFDEFFSVRKNLIFEHAKFNRRNQKEDESAVLYNSTLRDV